MDENGTTYHAETRLLPVDPRSPQPGVIAEAARVLRRGGLVAFPTETVYGLGALALDADAVAHIFAAKGRPPSDPLIVHIAALEQLGSVARDVPALARQLAGQFWPGPLTLVLYRQAGIPPNVAAGGPTVAVRMPAHPVALALIHAAGPLAAPSANRFSRPSPTSAAHVLADLGGRVDLVLDGGPVHIGLESTVIDLTCEPPAVLRPGGAPVEALRALIPALAVRQRSIAAGEPAPAPGMLLKHYSPDAQVILYDGPREVVLERIRADVVAHAAQGHRAGLLLFDEDVAALSGLEVERVSLGSASDLQAVGLALFAALRELDSRGVDVILVRGLAREGLGLAIWDRLLRAAEGRVVRVSGAG